MSYHLSPHIYITQFQDGLILLDLKKDKYTVCFKQFSDLLSSLLEEKEITSEDAFHLSKTTKQNNSTTSSFDTRGLNKKTKKLDSFLIRDDKQDKNNNENREDKQFFSSDLPTLQDLIDDDIIERKDTPYPFYIDRKPYSDGVSNVDWSLPLESKNISLNMAVCKVFMTLLTVNFYIKVRGFYRTVQLIKNSCKNHVTYITPSEEELKDLANIVNKACLIYPTRTKCLEWAITFILLALKRQWKCNLEIGVQNYPFMAHAWVECDGKVVMDSPDLREGLGIILNEPFRKLKA